MSTGQLELSSGKMHHISSLKGPHQKVVESSESYEWTKLLTTQQKLICKRVFNTHEYENKRVTHEYTSFFNP